jgi:thiol-disulfide isomerase/thioredoxin
MAAKTYLPILGKGILCVQLLFWFTAISQCASAAQITLKITGPDNQLLAGAKIYKNYYINNGLQKGKEYVADANGTVILPEDEMFGHEWEANGVILYGLYENTLAELLKVMPDDVGKEIEMKLTPVCRVYGKIESTELAGLNQKLLWTNIYVSRDNTSDFMCVSGQENFSFLLPAGKYKLYAYGTRMYGKSEDIEIIAGQKELEINFDLPADRMAYLIGEQAPELRQIQGWINSKPLTLAQLHGKVVLLNFWATWCGPCVREIPALIEVYEKYRDKGLVVIGIHTDTGISYPDGASKADSHLEGLKKAVKALSKKLWNDKTIPYPLALDGGGECEIEGTKITTLGATDAAYGIVSYPTCVLIDRNGKVVDDYYPDPRNYEVIEKLLAPDANDTH